MDQTEFSEVHLEDYQIERFKEGFIEGALLYVKVPVVLPRLSGSEDYGSFHLFLQSVKNESLFNLFARGPILFTAEKSKISGQIGSGIVAEYDDVVSEFLGDAETPSHTKLN